MSARAPRQNDDLAATRVPEQEAQMEPGALVSDAPAGGPQSANGRPVAVEVSLEEGGAEQGQSTSPRRSGETAPTQTLTVPHIDTNPGLVAPEPSRAGAPRIVSVELGSPSRRPPGRDRREPQFPGFQLPDPYIRWNEVLAAHCLFRAPDATGPCYLSITPRILSAALEAQDGELLSPEDAARDFVGAVSHAYQACVVGQREKLWSLAGQAADGAPRMIAFLALSVLAAYEMHSDEDAGPNAYYPRLASLLGCNLSGGHPKGFDPADFGDLWDWLSSWLEQRTGQPLALPGPEPGLRRYVAFPLCHVPLRQVDIEKLPDFFDWAGLEPGSKAYTGYLGEAFRCWVAGRGVLSRAGEAALEDERRAAIESQLALELQAWDGSWTDRSGRRAAAVHVLLDYRRRQPHLLFLPRRPASFPAVFDDGSHVFEAGEQGWYDPVPIAVDDGAALADGFRWTSETSHGQVSLHRPKCSALALRPAADFTGYLSQRGIPIGVESAVLCAASMEAAAEEYLSTVTSTHCRALRDPAVPEGWRLFSRIVPKRSDPPPPGLDALGVEETATVLFRGGLRIGRQAAWLGGAPPKILVGGPEGLSASIDGESADVVDGRLNTSGRLGVGQHVVRVGRVRRSIKIVNPEGQWERCAPLLAAGNYPSHTRLALPPGHWTVLGSRPDEVVHGSSSGRSTLVATKFTPVWAVSVSGGPGATVICLEDKPRAPATEDCLRRRAHTPSGAREWVATIYNAHIRRPRFGWLGEPMSEVELRAAWQRYWRAARALKRRWRRRT